MTCYTAGPPSGDKFLILRVKLGKYKYIYICIYVYITRVRIRMCTRYNAALRASNANTATTFQYCARLSVKVWHWLVPSRDCYRNNYCTRIYAISRPRQFRPCQTEINITGSPQTRTSVGRRRTRLLYSRVSKNQPKTPLTPAAENFRPPGALTILIIPF